MRGRKRVYGNSVLSAQFCCETKSTLKNNDENIYCIYMPKILPKILPMSKLKSRHLFICAILIEL